jgi:aldose 1-epimerase
MFRIEVLKVNQTKQSIVLKNDASDTFAIISMKNGANVECLKFDGVDVIQHPKQSDYAQNFASAILFPFTNRIENGVYNFNGKTYTLECNKAGENNAIHGLVHDKFFELIESEQTSDLAKVLLRYLENEPIAGFPFKYQMDVSYTLFKNTFKIDISVTNLDNSEFPFALGWHPYFVTSDVSKSMIRFSPKQHIVNNVNFVPKKLEPFQDSELHFNNGFYDDCYELKDAKVYFETPEYQLKIESSSVSNYLQVYTNAIETHLVAIEPMTAPANCFNNGIDVQLLQPNESYQLTWKLNFENSYK